MPTEINVIRKELELLREEEAKLQERLLGVKVTMGALEERLKSLYEQEDIKKD
jgi:hypothetical protein